MSSTSLLQYISPLPIVLFLAGCPQGSGPSTARQDGGDGADASGIEPIVAPDDGRRTSSGALCGVNGQDQCGVFQRCDLSLGCVECVDDADCPATAGRCLVGRCVACRPGAALVDGGVSDCPSAQSACFTTDYACHPRCRSVADCPAQTRCDDVTGECVGCASDADCATGVCSPQTRQCVGCVSDALCPAERPRCLLLTGTCAACDANEDCGIAKPICDPDTFACREGCSSDAACSGVRCDLGTGTCIDTDASLTDASPSTEDGGAQILDAGMGD